MRYRVRCDLAFTDKDIAGQVYKYLKLKLGSVVPIGTGEAVEGKTLQLELCRHDEGKSCEVLEDASR